MCCRYKSTFPQLGREHLRLAGPEIPRLVAVDVEPIRAEGGQEVGVQVVQEAVGLVARGGQAPAPADFVQVAVLG